MTTVSTTDARTGVFRNQQEHRRQQRAKRRPLNIGYFANTVSSQHERAQRLSWFYSRLPVQCSAEPSYTAHLGYDPAAKMCSAGDLHWTEITWVGTASLAKRALRVNCPLLHLCTLSGSPGTISLPRSSFSKLLRKFTYS